MALVLLVAVVPTGFAQDPKRPNPSQPQQPQDERRPNDPSNVKASDARSASADTDRAAQPGAEHRILEASIGSWQVTGQCWKKAGAAKSAEATRSGANRPSGSSADGARPDGSRAVEQAAETGKADATRTEMGAESITATVTSEWVLGNRFVKTHMRGTSGGDSIEGMGMCGYDNNNGKYVSTWQDTECTSIKMDEGTYEPSTKTFTYTGESAGPNGQMVTHRRTVRVVNNDEHVMTAYVTIGGAAEQKMAELTFRRSGVARTDAR